MHNRKKTPKPAAKATSPAGERLQKVLAAAGAGSRRECEDLIVQGRVELDGRVVTELGTRVAPGQNIHLDGEPVSAPRKFYYIVNKPPGVLSTNRDPQGRPRVVDLVDSDQRLFTVGRLDKSSEGLILLTNDGELANRLTHPRFGVEKRYHVEVAGHPPVEAIAQLRQGVRLAEGIARAKDVKVRKRHAKSTELEMVLDEGRNREIRRLLARIGHKVLRLTRVGIGPLKLGELPPGAHRLLTWQEIDALRRHVSGRGEQKKPRKKAAAKPHHRGRQRKRSP